MLYATRRWFLAVMYTLTLALPCIGGDSEQDGLKEFAYQFTAQAKRADASLKVGISGRVRAKDPQQAQYIAKEQVEKIYEGWKLDSIDIKIREITNLPSESHATVKIDLTCLSTFTKKGKSAVRIGPFSINEPDELIDLFSVKVQSTVDGKTDDFNGIIRTAFRGKSNNPNEKTLSFELWDGRLLPGEDPQLVQLTVLQKKPLEEGFEQIGVFKVRLQRTKDKLTVDWLPLDHAKNIGPSKTGPMHSTTFRLDGSGYKYDAFMTAYDKAEVEQENTKLQAERKAKMEERRRNLANPPKGIRVYNVLAEAETESPKGQKTQARAAKIAVVSEKEDEASIFAKRVFPSRIEVLIAKDEAEAKAHAEKMFRESFKNERLVPGTFKVTLTPKNDWTAIDELIQQHNEVIQQSMDALFEIIQRAPAQPHK